MSVVTVNIQSVSKTEHNIIQYYTCKICYKLLYYNNLHKQVYPKIKMKG